MFFRVLPLIPYNNIQAGVRIVEAILYYTGPRTVSIAGLFLGLIEQAALIWLHQQS